MFKHFLSDLKWPILAVSAKGEIWISSKQSFITSTTGPNPKNIISINFPLS